ncbi:DUF721 domain-containing protein [Litoreibacter arenae]|uniref:Zn-ribbon-containing protein n=1 Tax=Litoreibacter arenae DSM 19593 TaxID=1123360 RepID=S9QCW4_9RHOB|nr:DciA family protein [Litoreibacter arenae]EPX77787.1 hypothetical protein thalar_03514 [Litoreibacter arenae DSM 19593]
MSGFVDAQIRKAGEKRGFAVMRLLTHWEEIVGGDTARMARPLDVGYGREGFGATLTVLCNGSNAPLVQQLLPQIREKVNACYGYSAISRVRVTQTAPVGFSEGQLAFAAKPKEPTAPPPQVVAASKELASDVESDGLRQALERLGQNVMARTKNT